jgi:alkylation response protein AidB-like acyl-CoA dehydrogenase
VVAPLAIAGGGSAAQKAALLPKIAEGMLRIGVGISEVTADVAPTLASMRWTGGSTVGRSLSSITSGHTSS